MHACARWDVAPRQHPQQAQVWELADRVFGSCLAFFPTHYHPDAHGANGPLHLAQPLRCFQSEPTAWGGHSAPLARCAIEASVSLCCGYAVSETSAPLHI